MTTSKQLMNEYTQHFNYSYINIFHHNKIFYDMNELLKKLSFERTTLRTITNHT